MSGSVVQVAGVTVPMTLVSSTQLNSIGDDYDCGWFDDGCGGGDQSKSGHDKCEFERGGSECKGFGADGGAAAGPGDVWADADGYQSCAVGRGECLSDGAVCDAGDGAAGDYDASADAVRDEY